MNSPQVFYRAGCFGELTFCNDQRLGRISFYGVFTFAASSPLGTMLCCDVHVGLKLATTPYICLPCPEHEEDLAEVVARFPLSGRITNVVCDVTRSEDVCGAGKETAGYNGARCFRVSYWARHLAREGHIVAALPHVLSHARNYGEYNMEAYDRHRKVAVCDLDRSVYIRRWDPLPRRRSHLFRRLYIQPCPFQIMKSGLKPTSRFTTFGEKVNNIQ